MDHHQVVLGVTGFRRCGKNSTTSILEQRFGFKTYAFADALRQMASLVNPVISVAKAPKDLVEQLDAVLGYRKEFRYEDYRYQDLVDVLGYESAKEVPDFRQFLQRLGTEGIRNAFGPTAWVDALTRRVDAEAVPKVAISDVRFQSEADWVHARGGKLWRVIRPGHGGDDPHPSETEIPNLPADRELVASTLAELEALVVAAYETDILPMITPNPSSANATSSKSTKHSDAAKRASSAGGHPSGPIAGATGSTPT